MSQQDQILPLSVIDHAIAPIINSCRVALPFWVLLQTRLMDSDPYSIRTGHAVLFVWPAHDNIFAADDEFQASWIIQPHQDWLGYVAVACAALPVVRYGHGKFLGVLGPVGHVSCS